ncbi:MAG: aspartate-semialdehyde dehydrogenase [Bdellovibrionales bacterium]|nr:aspartate-semialdehyde dehydrogenase [Bdellovibrionales bacterium]
MDISNVRVGIIGATGVVGKQVLEILSQRELVPRSIHLAASKKSVGETLEFMGETLDVVELTDDFFEEVDVVICSAGSKMSQTFLNQKNLSKVVAIDNCSYFRMNKDVPLIIPEINGEVLSQKPPKNIIANPNCTTIAMLMAIAPIHKSMPIESVICSSYQSVSGAGQKGIEELSMQVQTIFQMGESTNKVFSHRIAFNCIPVIGALDEDGYSEEENKMKNETKKILDQNINVSSTCVRVPTFVGHGLSLTLQMKSPVVINEVRELLASAKGVKLLDAPEHNIYPILTDCQAKDDVYVGRVRHGLNESSVNMWVVSDNLRKGAALNAVQILEDVIEKNWFKN